MKIKKIITAVLLSLIILNEEIFPVMAANELEPRITITLPSSYDARDYGYITSGRSQYPYGTCWAFGAIATAEASLIKSGLADNSIDLSEYHLAYYSYVSKFNDPLGNTEGDYGIGSNIAAIMGYGGYSWNGAVQFAKWSGPVDESAMPYEDAKNQILPYTDLSAESLYHLNKAISGDSENKDEIKKLILQYGAVSSSYYSDVKNKYYNYTDYEEVTYHVPNAKIGNHEISIIGWDDNYPKEHFKFQPEKDGAWLVKDSTENHEWMWISYETCLDGVLTFEFESADLLENNYQYDGYTAADYQTFNEIVGSAEPQVVKNMNVFKAKKSQNTLEKLEAVMIQAEKNENCEITIYVNPVIKDGQLISYEYMSDNTHFCSEYNGLYKVDIPENIYLNAGDTFGIEISGERASTYPIMVSSKYGMETVHPGESYVGKIENSEFSYVDLADYRNSGNLRIKGFTNSTDIPLAGNVTIDTTEKKLKIGDTFTIHGKVSVPAGAMGGISFASSDPNVATVDANGKVKAINVGTATITVAATYGSSRSECTVTVEPTLATSTTSLKPSAPKKNIKVGTGFTCGGINYIVTSANTVKLCGVVNNNIKSLNVPATVKYSEKALRITEIGSKAFYNCKKLKSVSIGANVKKIGKGAFEGCKNLKTVKMGNSVTTIGARAFMNCTSLTTVKTSKSLAFIGNKAFYNCKKLKAFTIGKYVKKDKFL